MLSVSVSASRSLDSDIGRKYGRCTGGIGPITRRRGAVIAWKPLYHRRWAASSVYDIIRIIGKRTALIEDRADASPTAWRRHSPTFSG